MFPVIGLVVLLGMVFGGALGRRMEAIPHELPIIGDTAAGALIIGNAMKQLKALGGGFMKVMKGTGYKKQDYLDVIFLVSRLMKMLRTEAGCFAPILVQMRQNPAGSHAMFGGESIVDRDRYPHAGSGPTSQRSIVIPADAVGRPQGGAEPDGSLRYRAGSFAE